MGFSCPDPHQPGNCQVFFRTAEPDSSEDKAQLPHAAHAQGRRRSSAATAGKSFAVPFSQAVPFDGRFTLRVLVDTSVVEVYAQNGRAISTALYIPPSANNTAVALELLGKSTVSASVEGYGMGSAYA